MTYTQNTLTQRQIINKIAKFDWKTNWTVNEALDFWTSQTEFFNKIITEKKFNKHEFEIITRFVKELSSRFNSTTKKYFDLEDPRSFEELKELFLNVCKADIALLIQFNEKFDEILENFDSNSVYYKKLKSLFLVKHFSGSQEELKELFTEISNLLLDVVEIDPAAEKDCCKIVFDYLDKVFVNKDKKLFNQYTNIERIDFLYRYGNPRFVKRLKDNFEFKKRFIGGLFDHDKRSADNQGVYDIIDEIFNNRKVSKENRKTILKEIEGELGEYVKKVTEVRKNEENFYGEYAAYLTKYKGIKEDEIKELNRKDVYDEYKTLKNKYFGDTGKRRELFGFSKYEAKDIIKCVCGDMFNIDTMGETNIVLYPINNLSEKELEEISNSLKEHSKEIWEHNNNVCIGLMGEGLGKDYNFKVCNLPDDLRDITYILRLLGIYMVSHHQLYGAHDSSKGIGKAAGMDAIVWKIHDLISDLQGSYSSEEVENTDDSLSDWEPNIDKEEIKVLKDTISEMKNKTDEITSKMDAKMDELKKTVSAYYSENAELKEENKKLRKLLQENGLLEVDQREEDILERRKLYRITVVGGGHNANVGFKHLSKNANFLKQLADKNLDIKQFELKGEIADQKNKNFWKDIESGLISGSTDFIIVLQNKHSTGLDELKENPDYKHRITCFSELENGEITCIAQEFSFAKFEHYLKIALDKYEAIENNDLMALR